MTGEVKGTQLRRCLSRNKQSNSEKLSKNDHCPVEIASGTCTAVRSRSASVHTYVSSDHPETLVEKNAEDSISYGGECFNGKPVARTARDHKTDTFDFCDHDDDDDDDDGKARIINDSHGSKRKRVDSEELEPSSFKNVSKFKRARKALYNLKQPSVLLEKCKDISCKYDFQNLKDDRYTNRTDNGAHVKPFCLGNESLQQVCRVDVDVDNMLSKDDNEKQNLIKALNPDEAESVCKEENTKYLEPPDTNKNSSNNKVCPVCSLILSTENMEVINEHINSCLDRSSDSRVKESGSLDAPCEDVGEDLYFCQLCQKDLSRMNSQRRQQHINRCCDQASKEEVPPVNLVPVQSQCPICGKGFKSLKSRQTHLKKCAQEYSVGTNQLLEIVRREKQQADSTSLAAGSEENVPSAKNHSGVKRNRKSAVLGCDLDEETQLALALSASMAPPPPVSHAKKGAKGKGKKTKGGGELPALLLRDDESAQRAVMMRAAQVLCTQDNIDEDDEISCTPALAPSRLAQNIPDFQPSLGKEMLQEHPTSMTISEENNVTKSDCNEVKDNHMDVNSGIKSELVEDQLKESVDSSLESSALVDPLLSRSFLNALYDVELNESKPVEVKAPRPSPLWSLASLKDQSSQEFYVPGLLPSALPEQPQEPPKQSTATVQKIVSQNMIHGQAVHIAPTMETLGPAASESTMHLPKNTGEVDEWPEITPSQAVNVQILMDLCGEDNICDVSVDSQRMAAASGFCLDNDDNHEDYEESHTIPSGVSKLLHDLSSMINNSYLSDVVIKLKDSQELVAHSFILSLRSDLLAQMLIEQRAVSNEAGLVSLEFEQVEQSVFEVVLRHIYTGDVIIPENCELDDVTSLAQRLKLPCLWEACKKTMFQKKQARENEEGDETDDCIATDVAKLEEEIWKNDNDDDFCEDFETSKENDEEDVADLLNYEDIEQIMIFQTQSLQRKRSENLEESPGSSKPSVDNQQPDILETGFMCSYMQSKPGEVISQNESSPSTPPVTGRKLRVLPQDDNLSRNTVEGSQLPYSIEGSKASRNLLEEDNLSRSAVEESGNISSDNTEKGDKFELTTCFEKEHIVEEDLITKKEQLKSPKERRERRPLQDHCASSEFDKNQLLSHATSGIEQVRGGEPINDSDDVEVQPEDHVHGRSQICIHERGLEHVNEELPHTEKTVEDYAECTDIYNVSADLLNDEMVYEDVKETNTPGEVQDNSSKYLNLLVESCNKAGREALSLPAGKQRLEKEDFQGSPVEVALSGHVESEDSMEEIVANESITLISDNEEEVSDVSPRKTDVTIIPETPRVRERISTTSSSKLSVSEEDDVTVTGFSPSKSRRQLKEEANEFLSKLRQRAERGKQKRQGKEKSKSNGGTKEPWVEISAKCTTKKSPEKQANQAELSPSSRNIMTPPKGSTLNSGSHLSPRGCTSPGAPATRMTPGGDTSSSVSPMGTPPRGSKSPRGYRHRSFSPKTLNDDCVSEVIAVGNSPPLSPVLVDDDAPKTSETSRKARDKMVSLCNGDCRLGEKEFDSGEANNIENVGSCGDKTEVDIYQDLPLSTRSSPRDVMSPPVPSPSYSFLEAVSSPGSPVPYGSPPSQKIALSPDPDSPSLPVDWKSPASVRGLGTSPEPHPSVSPSVCSFSSQIAPARHSENRRKYLVKKLDFQKSLKDNEDPGRVEVVEIDPNVPLMERLKAARGVGHKMCCLRDVEKDGSDTNSNDFCMKNEGKNGSKDSSTVSSQNKEEKNSLLEAKQMANIFVGEGFDFDFYDDGGYNFDIDEVNKLEGCPDDKDSNNTAKEGRHCNKNVKKDNQLNQRKAARTAKGKKKIPSSQQTGQDSDNEVQEAPSKRGKKTDTQSSKPVGQTMKQPVTPMPNYNEMATPVLKTELHKFGVRPLPKKKMILKLREIYDYTHPAEPRAQESKTELASNRGQPLFSKGIEGSGTASSDNSDQEDTEFGDCTVMIEDDVITASQQVNGGNLKERLLCYFRDSKELYKKLLQFQPLELVSLHQQIKSAGISCALGKLVDFLDEQCITFTTAGSRAPRRRGRKKKTNHDKPS